MMMRKIKILLGIDLKLKQKIVSITKLKKPKRILVFFLLLYSSTLNISLPVVSPYNWVCSRCLFPKSNNKEYNEWKKKYEKKGKYDKIRFIEVSTINEVFKYVFVDDEN